jgi:dipeptidyl aminopeptidase/acylaminoacyl peptidase
VLKLDTQTGKVTELFIEDPSIDCPSMPTSHIRTVMMPLPESNEVIWYSERSGWAHLYLYDLTTGQLKNTITSGDWLVRGLLHYDATRRDLFIQTANRTPGRNPYYCDIGRVNIDTGELTTLMSTDHDYSVADCRYTPSTINQGVSPSANYIVTTRARIDDAPVSLLLDRDGNELLTLETADFSAMPDNWQWPEPVMLKGADNKTAIHGIIYRPADFDPNKSYPVLDLSWGHSPPITPAVGGWMFYGALAWAELGFIVVKFGNRGGGLRHKAFHDDINPALPHYNKDDCAAAIRQLAERFPYMDITRVGLASYTLYPEASTGLLIHPDLYKVGVDINPMTDARLMPKIGNFGGGTKCPPHENFVNKLRGKLLLIHGMMEDVVLVGATFRLVEALQKANKPFDMLVLPNVDHHGPLDYATRRSWDFMVTHLLGVAPPMDFDMNEVDG